MELSKEERNAINTLKRLANRWPDSLWIFAAGGQLNIMKYGEDGQRVLTEFGGMDQEYCIDSILIISDGGNW